MFISKKADAIWMSWVLLVAFTVGLGVFMMNWSTERHEVFAQELTVMSDTAECDSVGIRITDICQNPQSLNMNITNRNSIRVNQLVMNIYDVYLEAPVSRAVNVSIYPEDTESVRVLKQSTTQQIDIVPVVFTETDMIFCHRKSVSVSTVDMC